jgi:chromosome segregation ATPase
MEPQVLDAFCRLIEQIPPQAGLACQAFEGLLNQYIKQLKDDARDAKNSAMLNYMNRCDLQNEIGFLKNKIVILGKYKEIVEGSIEAEKAGLWKLNWRVKNQRKELARLNKQLAQIIGGPA